MQNSVGNIDGDLAIVYNQSNNNYYQGIFKYDNNSWTVAPTELTATSRDVLYPVTFER